MSARLDAAVRARFGSDPRPGGAADPVAEEALFRLIDRRSCRAFAPRAVEPGLLDLILAAGLSAPTKSDLQQADIVVIEDAGLRARIVAGLPGAEWMRAAPVFLVVCANGQRLAELFEGRDFPNDHFDALFNATLDAGLVLESLVAAAAVAGLGSCPVSQIRNRAAEVGLLLALPPRVFAVAGLALGWPDGAAPLSPRLDLAVTLHRDRHDGAAFARLVAGYDARRSAAEGKPADAPGWSDAKRRQYAEPFRRDFGSHLREIGFRFD